MHVAGGLKGHADGQIVLDGASRLHGGLQRYGAVRMVACRVSEAGCQVGPRSSGATGGVWPSRVGEKALHSGKTRVV